MCEKKFSSVAYILSSFYLLGVSPSPIYLCQLLHFMVGTLLKSWYLHCPLILNLWSSALIIGLESSEYAHLMVDG